MFSYISPLPKAHYVSPGQLSSTCPPHSSWIQEASPSLFEAALAEEEKEKGELSTSLSLLQLEVTHISQDTSWPHPMT